MPRALAAVGAFMVCFTILQVAAASRTSATWDEPAHLTAGYAALAHGDYRIDPAHPPLARMWAALPLLFLDGVAMDRTAIDAVTSEDWVLNGRAYPFARQFLYRQNDGDRLLLASRAMVVLLGAVLGVLVFAWAYQWRGLSAGVLALALVLLSPNLAAHATLVTTDMAVTCLAFGAAYFLWRTCTQFTPLNVGLACLLFALAVTTKFSALLLLPAAALMLAVAVRAGALTPRQALTVVLVAGATTYGAIWAVYGFRYAPAPAGWTFELEAMEQLRARAPFTADVAGWVDRHRLLPNAFTQGILLLQISSAANPAYLAGEISVDGWWYYFPYAFLIKTPIALLGLIGAGVWVGFRATRRGSGLAVAFIVIPALAFIVIAMTAGLNIGLRHILPAFPFAILLGAAAAQAMALSGSLLARGALAGLLLFGTVEYVRAYPHPLTFFNEFVGGPENGYKHLADSNLGWGQQLKPLKAWMEANDIDHVNLAYFGQAEPAYYGIDHVLLPGSSIATEETLRRPRLPGYVAISGTVLTGVYLHPAWRLFYRPFLEMEPVAILGNSMRVYWVNQWPIAEPNLDPGSGEIAAAVGLGMALSEGLNWPELATEYLSLAERAAPNDPNIRALLARVRTK